MLCHWWRRGSKCCVIDGGGGANAVSLVEEGEQML